MDLCYSQRPVPLQTGAVPFRIQCRDRLLDVFFHGFGLHLGFLFQLLLRHFLEHDYSNIEYHSIGIGAQEG